MKKEPKIPIYISMYKNIKDKIEKKIYPIGMFLPCEEELQKEYNVSRTTVRHAVALLQKEGLVCVQQGCGTEVVRNKISQTLNDITSVSQSLKNMGYEVGVSSMFMERIFATHELANELMVPEGEPLILISRIQTANGTPIAIAKNYIIEKFVPGILNEEENIVSLYKYIENKYSLRITKVRDRIGADSANFDESISLNIDTKSALIVVRRVCFTNDIPFEVDYVKIIADKYEYRNDFEMRGE